MSKFENITPADIHMWVNKVTLRLMAVVTVDGEWHEVAMRDERVTMQEIIDALKQEPPRKEVQP